MTKTPKYPIEGVAYPGAEDAARYQRVGAWHTLSAGDALREAALRAPNKCALVCDGQRVTYSEFDSASEKLGAALLDLGLRPGDRALFQMGSVVETAIANALNQPVLVENRPGAGGNIGSDAVAKAAPDGYTLLMTPSNLAIAPSIYRNLPFDALKDLAPVSQLCSTYLILVTNSKLPAMSVRELIALAKSRPAGMNYGHAGAGSTLQLTMELLKTLTGIDIQAIPYKGTSPISTALVAGEVDAAFMSLATVVPHINAGKLRALAVTSSARSPVMPEVPTVVEAGVRDFVGLPGWFGLFAPARTPRDIVELIQQQAVKALKISDLRDRIFGMGWEIVGSTPTEFEETYKADIAKFARIVKEARVPLQD